MSELVARYTPIKLTGVLFHNCFFREEKKRRPVLMTGLKVTGSIITLLAVEIIVKSRKVKPGWGDIMVPRKRSMGNKVLRLAILWSILNSRDI